MSDNFETQIDQANSDGPELRQRLLGETARAPWAELQRFFAQGLVLAADGRLDLIEVGVVLATDNTAQFTHWREQGLLDQVSDEQASRWHEGDARLWTMVVKPWIVVQPEDAKLERRG